MKFNPDPVIRSAYRISEAAKKLKETQEPGLFDLIKRESTILVRRAIKLWWQLRFGR